LNDLVLSSPIYVHIVFMCTNGLGLSLLIIACIYIYMYIHTYIDIYVNMSPVNNDKLVHKQQAIKGLTIMTIWCKYNKKTNKIVNAF